MWFHGLSVVESFWMSKNIFISVHAFGAPDILCKLQYVRHLTCTNN